MLLVFLVVGITNELSTKSRVMGDCQARYREKEG